MYRKRSFRLGVLLAFLTTVTSIDGEKSEMRRFETVHNSNAAILQRLGLVPVRIPEGHHKKRLSGPQPSDVMDIELGSRSRIHQPYSRRHGHSDSHVYVVKLPPSQPYYTLTKPHKADTESGKDNEKKTKIVSSSPQVGFQSNGKPGKIYHWNLPLVKKITEKKKYHAQMKMEEMRRRLEEEEKERPKIPNESSKKNATSVQVSKKHLNQEKSSKPEDTIVKHNHHSTSLNSLNHDEKPIKHTRNNDKRLNYPRLPEQIRKPVSFEDHQKNQVREDNEKVGKKNNKNSKKSYRLEEDSNLYRLESRNNNERHKNDRLAVWSLSNELHASGNTQNSLRPKKHRKKAAMSYYAPINSRTSKIDANPSTNNIQKNFSSNGKPKAFYVMEKNRQPVYYHPLLP